MNARVSQGKRQQRRTTSDRYFSSSDDDDDDDLFEDDKTFDADEFDRVATKVVATKKKKKLTSSRSCNSNAMIRGAKPPTSSTISLFTNPANKLFKSVPLSTADTDDTTYDEEILSVTLTEYQRKVSFVCAEHDQCATAASSQSLNLSHDNNITRTAREQYNAFTKKKRRKQVVAITLMILGLVIALIVGISMGVNTRKERSSSVVSIADEEEDLSIVNYVADAADDEIMEVDADSTLTVNQQEEDEDEEDGRQEDDEDNSVYPLVDDYPLIDDIVENVVSNPNTPIATGEEDNTSEENNNPQPTSRPTDKPMKKVVEEEEKKENEEVGDTIIATCGKGKQGNGICPIQGECCSKFGWCSNTVEHCSTSSGLVGGTATTANSNANVGTSNPNVDTGNPNNIITVSTLPDTVFAAAKIDLPANSHLTIKLKTDAHGEETSWTLHSVDKTNAQMKLISSVNENTYGPSEEDVVEIDIAPGKYRFTLKDAFGDGGTESYAVSLDGREVIRGDKYRKEVSYDILVGNDPALIMSTRDKEYLAAHNTRRKTWHERYDKVYVPLTWSTSLAKDAINYAEKLLNDCEVDGIVHEENVDSGENLAKNRGSGSWAQLYPVENVRTLLLMCAV